MDKLNYILDSLPPYYKKEENSKIYNILNPIARQLDNFIADLDKAKESKYIDLAKADDLDKVGKLINVERIHGENDEAYRGRIKTTVPSFIGGGTVEAINDAVKKYIGVEPTIIEHYKPGQGHAFFDTGIVNGLNVEKLLDTVNDYKINSGAFYKGGKRFFLENVLFNPTKSGYVKYNIIDSTKTYLDGFQNKISGSILENANTIHYRTDHTWGSEISPTDPAWIEFNQTQINNIKEKDANKTSITGQTVLDLGPAIKISFDLVTIYEKNIGKINKETQSEKLQWVKDNLRNFVIYAKGNVKMGVNERSGSFGIWDKSGYPTPFGWSYSTSGDIWIDRDSEIRFRIDEKPSWKNSWIMDDGKMHFIITPSSYSDGTNPSIITLDYIKFGLEFNYNSHFSLEDSELSTENQVNLAKLTSLSGTTDFKGKASKDPNNKNWMKTIGSDVGTPLPNPDTIYGSMFDSSYSNIEALDNWWLRVSATAGRRAEKLLAYDLVSYFEKKYGTISGDKIAWVKSKISTLKFNWWGYAEGDGKTAILMPWNNTTSSWDTTLLKENREQVSKLIELPISSNIANYVDSKGFVYFLIYANDSILSTDYVNLDIKENIFELQDIRTMLNPEEHYITNTASITVQISYDFNNSNISLEDVKDILRNTKAAGIALLIKVTDTYQDTATLQDTATANFIVGVSGVGGNNTLGGA